MGARRGGGSQAELKGRRWREATVSCRTLGKLWRHTDFRVLTILQNITNSFQYSALSKQLTGLEMTQNDLLWHHVDKTWILWPSHNCIRLRECIWCIYKLYFSVSTWTSPVMDWIFLAHLKPPISKILPWSIKPFLSKYDLYLWSATPSLSLPGQLQCVTVTHGCFCSSAVMKSEHLLWQDDLTANSQHTAAKWV